MQRSFALVLAAAMSLAPAVQSQPAPAARGESDGYDLWLRYPLVADTARLREYRAAITQLVVLGDSPTMQAARDELQRGLRGLLGREVPVVDEPTLDGALVVGSLAQLQTGGRQYVAATVRALPHPQAFLIAAAPVKGRRAIVVASQSEVGALYGAFRLLREMQTGQSLARILLADAPKVALRVLDHWDNLDRTVERGYAGQSIWAWDSLPAQVSPRYRDYARANASIGINGAVLTNVNASSRVLTPEYLAKVAAIASVLRPYGIRTYLTARFSAPVEIGGLKTADPLDPAVQRWWKDKADEIWRAIPDFGGFLVKANSEGQPGPQQYGRTHADGANMLADAVAPHGGVVMWRAFVYANDVPTDRVRQAYDEFHPLDGAFRDNVLVQVKNGPLDFQPREPFHPLFGAMPRTPLMLELQVTKEYLGQDTHLAYLGTLWEEVLAADTRGEADDASTVARIVDGTREHHALTGIAGVANVGTDRDWTGSHFNQANWYAFGRMAWEPTASARALAEEWTRMTWSNDPAVVARIVHLMLVSREAVVSYTGPLGLAHQMATGHHYGPGPWADAGRADWNPRYYHRADTLGIGFDRTATGSNAVAQYAPRVRERWANVATTPDSLLLWFHHVPWTHRMPSGRTLWHELVARYDAGVDTVRAMQQSWASLAGRVDDARWRDVRDDLAIQAHEARWWRDASIAWFQTLSRLPLPARAAPPAHPLDWYEHLQCPADPRKPRCPAVY